LIANKIGRFSMYIKDLKDCEEFTAGDNSILRELLHPDKANLAIRYSLAHAVVKQGQTAIPHKLKTSEVYYILEGEGIMHIDEEAKDVYPGQAIYIPPGSKQYISNNGKSDLVFLCIVDPAWRKQDEEVL
jgi:mannose-6-phosphate isomerase-like protein (cupin superfamily)